MPRGIFADRGLRVGAAYSMAKDVHRSVAVRGGDIVAVSPDPAGLDGLIGDSTAVVDGPDLTLLPAFDDAYEHPAGDSSEPEPRPWGRSSKHRRIRERDPPRRRDVPTWAVGPDIDGLDESNLAEGRLPTRAEVDAASPDASRHCAARRAPRERQLSPLRVAGITAATPTQPEGQSAAAGTVS